jgi:hypothetical protein
VLDAPCTEVFTAYGTDNVEAFAGQVSAFVDKVEENPPTGYFAAAVGLNSGVVAGEGDGEEGGQQEGGGGSGGGGGGGEEGEGDNTVRLLIGWASKESHMAAKGVEGGVLGENIHLLRTGRRWVFSSLFLFSSSLPLWMSLGGFLRT